MCGNAPADDHRVLARARSPAPAVSTRGREGLAAAQSPTQCMRSAMSRRSSIALSRAPCRRESAWDLKTQTTTATNLTAQERECVGFKNTNDDTDNNDANNTA